MHKHKKYNKIIIIVLTLILLFSTVILIWLYSGTLSPYKKAVFNAFPLPLAYVGNQNITVKEFLLRQKAANLILGSASSNQDSEKNKTLIYNALVNQAKSALIAEKFGISTSQKEINLNYQIRLSQANLEGMKNFSELLAKYGLDEESFKNLIIKPELLINNIKIWHASNKNLNKANYQLAEELAKKIQDGEDMSSLAKTYSQDETSKILLGDLGFMDISESLTELKEPLANMNVGEVKIIPSRFGLHIFRLEEKRGNEIHLRQIFLLDSEFDNWYNNLAGNIKIYKFINI